MDGKFISTLLPQCGWSDIPCITLQTVLNMTGIYSSVTLEKSTYITSAISGSITKGMEICGEDKSGVIVMLDGEGMRILTDSTVTISNMTVCINATTSFESLSTSSLESTQSVPPIFFVCHTGTGALTVSNVSFTSLPPSLIPLTQPLIESTTGTLMLSSVSFNYISTEGVPLVSISGKAFMINNGSEFTSVTTGNGSGGIVDVHVEERVNISGVTFTKCVNDNQDSLNIASLYI